MCMYILPVALYFACDVILMRVFFLPSRQQQVVARRESFAVLPARVFSRRAYVTATASAAMARMSLAAVRFNFCVVFDFHRVLFWTETSLFLTIAFTTMRLRILCTAPL